MSCTENAEPAGNSAKHKATCVLPISIRCVRRQSDLGDRDSSTLDSLADDVGRAIRRFRSSVLPCALHLQHERRWMRLSVFRASERGHVSPVPAAWFVAVQSRLVGDDDSDDHRKDN
jgi:hypothetical protein